MSARLVAPHGGALVDLFAAPDRAAEISDSCEAPDDAEITLDTAELTAEEAAQKMVLHLEKEGNVSGEPAERRSWGTR